MKASDFVNEYASKGLAAWETKAYDMIVRGEIPELGLREVLVETKDGKHHGSFQAARDYLTIGEPGDFMRMPLTPKVAQKVADFFGMQLPTSRMVDAIWKSAATKLTPRPMVPNRNVNLPQFLEHSRLVDEQIGAGDGNLLAGHKKDVMVSKTMPAGKVIIYGWHRPDGTHIQPRSSIHSENYIDYSHGIRLVAPTMQVDGRSMRVDEVLRDPELASLLSDEGVVQNPRYGAAVGPLHRGFQIVQRWGEEIFGGERQIA